MIGTAANATRSALALLGIALVCVVGIIVLAALKIDIPAILEVLATAALTGGAGVTVPAHVSVPASPAPAAPAAGQGA